MEVSDVGSVNGLITKRLGVRLAEQGFEASSWPRICNSTADSRTPGSSANPSMPSMALSKLKWCQAGAMKRNDWDL